MSESRAEFDFEQAFDEDYLYFYDPWLTGDVSDRQAETIWGVLELRPGMEVLDLACGHGRIANRLAERGAHMTGLDAMPLFLERARRDAAERGVEVEYVHGDMRALPWRERFDVIVCWFTSFGYFDDDGNRQVLAEAYDALRPGGRLLIENNHLPWILRNYRPFDVAERGDDFLIDEWEFDVRTSRGLHKRIVVRDGRVRRFRYFVRMFTFAELRSWLRRAGFVDVVGFDSAGNELELDSRRMITIGRR